MDKDYFSISHHSNFGNEKKNISQTKRFKKLAISLYLPAL